LNNGDQAALTNGESPAHDDAPKFYDKTKSEYGKQSAVEESDIYSSLPPSINQSTIDFDFSKITPPSKNSISSQPHDRSREINAISPLPSTPKLSAQVLSSTEPQLPLSPPPSAPRRVHSLDKVPGPPTTKTLSKSVSTFALPSSSIYNKFASILREELQAGRDRVLLPPNKSVENVTYRGIHDHAEYDRNSSAGAASTDKDPHRRMVKAKDGTTSRDRSPAGKTESERGKSFGKAISDAKQETNSRSRKASQSLRLFKEANLPEDREKIKEKRDKDRTQKAREKDIKEKTVDESEQENGDNFQAGTSLATTLASQYNNSVTSFHSVFDSPNLSGVDDKKSLTSNRNDSHHVSVVSSPLDIEEKRFDHANLGVPAASSSRKEGLRSSYFPTEQSSHELIEKSDSSSHQNDDNPSVALPITSPSGTELKEYSSLVSPRTLLPTSVPPSSAEVSTEVYEDDCNGDLADVEDEEDEDSEKEQVYSALYIPHKTPSMAPRSSPEDPEPTTIDETLVPTEIPLSELDLDRRSSGEFEQDEVISPTRWAGKASGQDGLVSEFELSIGSDNRFPKGMTKNVAALAEFHSNDSVPGLPITSLLDAEARYQSDMTDNESGAETSSNYSYASSRTTSEAEWYDSATDRDLSDSDVDTTPTATPTAYQSISKPRKTHHHQRHHHHSTSYSKSKNDSQTDVPPLDTVELKPYNHQVGGHTALYRFSKRAICKSLNNRENEFYEAIERTHVDMLKFMPR